MGWFARPRLPLCLGLLACLFGCAPSLTQMRAARTVPAGHVETTVTLEGSLPQGRALADFSEALDMLPVGTDVSPDQVQTLTRAASTLFLQQPGLSERLVTAVGLTQRIELHAEITTARVGGGLRYQFLRVAPGFYGAAGVRFSGYPFGFPIAGFIPDVTVKSFSRTELNLPLSFGYSGSHFHAWAGPSMTFGWQSADFNICIQKRNDVCTQEARNQVDAWTRYMGGHVGLGVGNGSWWIAAELAFSHLTARTDVDTEIRGQTAAAALPLEAWILAPGLGLMLWW